MGAGIVAAGQQCLGFAAALVGQFGLENPRGRSAEQGGDARRTVARARAAHCLDETVLQQGDLRQAVVAAIEFRERPRNRTVFDAVDAPDPGGMRETA